jgi:Tfp pilus assembly protein PilF
MYDFKGALKDINIVLNKDPDDKLALITRMCIKRQLRDKKGACEDYQKVLALGNDRIAEMEPYCK